MGDVILTTPLFSYIKQHDPEAEIVFCTNTLYADLFKDDPRLSSVIPFNRRNADNILPELSSQNRDRIIDLQNSRRSKSYPKRYFPKIDTSVFNKLHGKRFLLLLLRMNFYGSRSSVAERYIEASGITLKTPEDIPPAKLFFNDDTVYETHLSADSGDIAKPTIALFPFSAWKNKQWSFSSYAAVGKHFSKKGWNVVLFGGPEDTAQATALKNEIGGAAISLDGSLNLYEIGCFLKKCTLALGGDTGLSHLARAAGVKTGIIYGATTYHFGFFPHGEPPYKIFQSKRFCRPCHAHGGNLCWRMSRPCLKSIASGEVIEGLQKLAAN